MIYLSNPQGVAYFYFLESNVNTFIKGLHFPVTNPVST
jgi:hypothetical protein